jgi:hypothetical protein
MKNTSQKISHHPHIGGEAAYFQFSAAIPSGSHNSLRSPQTGFCLTQIKKAGRTGVPYLRELDSKRDRSPDEKMPADAIAASKPLPYR